MAPTSGVRVNRRLDQVALRPTGLFRRLPGDPTDRDTAGEDPAQPGGHQLGAGGKLGLERSTLERHGQGRARERSDNPEYTAVGRHHADPEIRVRPEVAGRLAWEDRSYDAYQPAGCDYRCVGRDTHARSHIQHERALHTFTGSTCRRQVSRSEAVSPTLGQLEQCPQPQVLLLHRLQRQHLHGQRIALRRQLPETRACRPCVRQPAVEAKDRC
jgi:hypothetical protein